jgi:hypothetical protein
MLWFVRKKECWTLYTLRNCHGFTSQSDFFSHGSAPKARIPIAPVLDLLWIHHDESIAWGCINEHGLVIPVIGRSSCRMSFASYMSITHCTNITLGCIKMPKILFETKVKACYEYCARILKEYQLRTGTARHNESRKIDSANFVSTRSVAWVATPIMPIAVKYQSLG